MRRTVPLAVLVGAVAGASGIALTLLLHAVQHLAFGYHGGTFLLGVEHASALRRVLALTVGGAVVGLAWWRLPVRQPVVDAVVQIVGVGVGAPLGREGAPRLVGGAAGGWLADRFRADRRLLVACGAGAGLAAVYDVPLAGAAFALETLLVSASLADAVPVVAASAVATVVAWPVLGDHPVYAVGTLHLSGAVVVGSLVVGALAGPLARGFRVLTTGPTVLRRWTVPAVTAAFAAVGGLAVAYPELPGNGRGLAQLSLAGGLGAGTLAVLLVLRPLAAGACLRAGARGGLLTPALATGAALGGLVGVGWSHLWAGGSPGAYAFVGAAAVLAATQRAPLTAVLFVVEVTGGGLPLVAPTALAVALAVVLGGRGPTVSAVIGR